MRYLAAAALLASLTACALEPAGYTFGVGLGDTGFSGGRGATNGLEMETVSVWVEVHWDAHRPVTHEVRALRNDMRVRHHEATVEEEEEEEKAELIAEAAEQARTIPEDEERGSWDWLFDNIEVWVMVLAGLLGILWKVGVWVGQKEAQENK